MLIQNVLRIWEQPITTLAGITWHICIYSGCFIRVLNLISSFYNTYDVGNTRKDKAATEGGRGEAKKWVRV